ncbi:helix-turn-helix domain-containing protein [Paraburkholderia sp. BCC1884]|uniref:helix-turn-helix domain-containing protein n=1 Tax=Paraburkholderia sp. BCC1884 TaxID=2562668 RepID=UPI0016431EB1|nr:helix-turn-helix transcriptional regulator [Paraburkholderia sp. BCC1884]
MDGRPQRQKHVESVSRDVSLTDDAPHAVLIETLDDSTVVDWHSHEFAQILCPSKGVVAVILSDWLCLVPQNYGVWIPANVLHTVVAGISTALDIVCIKQTGTSIESRPAQPVIRRMEPRADKNHPDQLPAVFHQDEDMDAPEYQLVQYLYGVPIPRDRRARPIAFGLVTSLHDLRTLKEWGAQSGASERTLMRIFQTEVGMSFRAWRTRLQVAQTIALLLCGQSVKSAACSAGYSSPSAFVAAFRLATGESPMRYLRNSQWDGLKDQKEVGTQG